MSEGLLFEPLDIALRVAAAIESNGGNYFVGGSLASSLQGEPRATNDIDLVIELPLGEIGNFRSSLGADFELDEDMLRDALLHARSANAFYLPTTTKIDFFGRGYDGFDAIEFERRQALAVKKTGDVREDTRRYDSSEVALVPRRGMCLGPPMAGRGVGSSNQCNAVR